MSVVYPKVLAVIDEGVYRGRRHWLVELEDEDGRKICCPDGGAKNPGEAVDNARASFKGRLEKREEERRELERLSKMTERVLARAMGF